MQRQIFIALFIAVFAAGLGMGIVAPLLPLYAQQYGAQGFAIGLVFASFSISRTVLLPFIGMISDKRGRKVFITLGLLLLTFTSVGYVVSRSVEALIVTRMLQGIAAALVIPIVLAYMGEITLLGKEGTTMGLFNIFFFGGLATGPLLGGLVKDLAGIACSFYSMGTVALVGFFLTLFLLPESAVVKNIQHPEVNPLKRIFEAGPIRGIYLFRFCFAMGIGLTWSFLPIYAHDVMRLTSSHIGLAISLNILIATLLQTPCGMLADRFSKEGLVIIGGCLAAAALSLIPLTRNFLELMLVSILWGIAGGFAMPALTALAVEEGKRVGGMGTLMSIFVMCHSFGMIFGPLVAGTLAQFVDISVVFFAGGLLGLVGVGGIVYFQRRSSIQS